MLICLLLRCSSYPLLLLSVDPENSRPSTLPHVFGAVFGDSMDALNPLPCDDRTPLAFISFVLLFLALPRDRPVVPFRGLDAIRLLASISSSCPLSYGPDIIPPSLWVA